MGKRTKLFQIMPWTGGLNTSIDPAMIDPQQLTRADNTVFGTRASKKVREGINFDWDDASEEIEDIIGLKHFWRDIGVAQKDNERIAVSTDKNIYEYTSSGTRSTLSLDAGITPWTDDITSVSFEVINNRLIIAVDGQANQIRKWDGGTADVEDLGGGAPRGSLVRSHLGRLWTNDKLNKDRLHYSSPSNHEEWNGAGDSGALDIGIGDGDPSGITAIFPTFKGDLFVAKKTKLYRVSGTTPEGFVITKVSDGIGCISHNSITSVDQDDILFVSERGVHSLVSTSNFGDFESKFISRDIQKTFNEEFRRTQLPTTQGLYIPELNSVAFTFSDDTYTGTKNNVLYLYNIEFQAWYRWPAISCTAIAMFDEGDRQRPFFGGSNNRVARALTGDKNDVDSDGNDAAIPFTIRTGFIFPEQDPYNVKGFKKLGILYTPSGSHTLTANFKIDNYSSQELTFDEAVATDLLGVDFVLGESILGFDIVLAPFAQPVDGYGRGFELTLSHESIDEDIEIQGFVVEYESAGTSQEVVIATD